jgi:hypothetical protein
LLLPSPLSSTPPYPDPSFLHYPPPWGTRLLSIGIALPDLLFSGRFIHAFSPSYLLSFQTTFLTREKETFFHISGEYELLKGSKKDTALRIGGIIGYKTAPSKFFPTFSVEFSREVFRLSGTPFPWILYLGGEILGGAETDTGKKYETLPFLFRGYLRLAQPLSFSFSYGVSNLSPLKITHYFWIQHSLNSFP